jgi:O-antigen/teichoic acid export membrane protein
LIGAGYIKFTTALYVITTVLFIIFIYFGSKQFGLLGGASANLIVFLLLGFNIYAYMKIPEKFSLRELIQDNLLWVLIPIIFTILMLITELLVVKILASVVLMTISLIWLVRDSTTKNYIIKIPGLNKFLLYCKIYQK